MKTYHPIDNPKSIDEQRMDYFISYWSFLNPFSWFKCHHDFDDTTEMRKERYEDHKHTDDIHIYTVTTRKCKCGTIVYDSGLERRPEVTDEQFDDWVFNR